MRVLSTDNAIAGTVFILYALKMVKVSIRFIMLFLLQFLGAAEFLSLPPFLVESFEDHNTRVCNGMYKDPNGNLFVAPGRCIWASGTTVDVGEIGLPATMDYILINWDAGTPSCPDQFLTNTATSLRSIVLNKLREIAPEIFVEIADENMVWINFANFLYTIRSTANLDTILAETQDKNSCTEINSVLLRRYQVLEDFTRRFFEESRYYYNLQSVLRDYYTQVKGVFRKLYRHKPADSMSFATLSCARKDPDLYDLTTDCLVRWFETVSDKGFRNEIFCTDHADPFWDLLVTSADGRAKGIRTLIARGSNPTIKNMVSLVRFAERKSKLTSEELDPILLSILDKLTKVALCARKTRDIFELLSKIPKASLALAIREAATSFVNGQKQNGTVYCDEFGCCYDDRQNPYLLERTLESLILNTEVTNS